MLGVLINGDGLRFLPFASMRPWRDPSLSIAVPGARGRNFAMFAVMFATLRNGVVFGIRADDFFDFAVVFISVINPPFVHKIHLAAFYQSE